MGSVGDMKIANNEDEDHSSCVDGSETAVADTHLSLPLGAAQSRTPSLAMAHSLAQSCTQLKLEYDSCFNSWFEGYLEPAVTASVSHESRAKYSKEKAD